MKRMLIAFLLLTAAASGYERLQGPTELLFVDREKALPGMCSSAWAAAPS